MPRRVRITVRCHPQNALEIRVDPWLRQLDSGEEVEWTLQNIGCGDASFETFDKPHPQRALPGKHGGAEHRRGPFTPHPNAQAGTDGVLEQYNIRLDVNGQTIVLDPDYRVKP
jgi:hypothetical protein